MTARRASPASVRATPEIVSGIKGVRVCLQRTFEREDSTGHVALLRKPCSKLTGGGFAPTSTPDGTPTPVEVSMTPASE